MRQAISLPEQKFFILYHQSLLWAWSEVCRETSSHPEKTKNFSHIFPSYASWTNNRYYLVLKNITASKPLVYETQHLYLYLYYKLVYLEKGQFQNQVQMQKPADFFSLGFQPLFLAYDGSDAESK